MAEVFAGSSLGDHGFQKPVAIKRLLPELATDHVFVERLIGEAKLLVGMQHGNIVSVLDLARDGDDVFLVMEFVDGPSLRQLLRSRGQRGLPVGVATYIVQAAAAGLEFAHARPGGAVIHADISPSNLLLTTSGEVRVADFGIARREGGGHGIVEGKWAYMAPEQARGEPLTPRSDVFALGVVLYELICGAHPFGQKVTAEERDSEPMRVIPPRVVKPSVPRGVDAICMRALAHDPRDRYAGMQQLIDALVEERFSNGWREGASDLAQAIREGSPHTATHQPRTMITDRPVTIVTRSLLRELTPGARTAVGTPAPTPVSPLDSGARKAIVDPELRAAALLELPATLRSDGTPMPPFRIAGQEHASVIDGQTVTGSHHVAVELEARSTTRWTIGVLAIAAVIGAIAAVVIQLAPNDQSLARPSGRASENPDSESQRIGEQLSRPVPLESSAPGVPAQEPIAEHTAIPEQPTPPAPGPVALTVPTPVPQIPAPTPTREVRAAPVRKKAPGVLRVNSDPWSYVSVAGQRKATVAKFTLPPGRYTVRFQNDEIGRSVTKSAVVESGKVTILTANLEEDN